MNRLHSAAFAVALALVLGTSTLLPAAPVLANALGRDRDPLVLTGASLASLVGTAPSRIVAFRWDGQWTQNPVQVDERTLVDFGAIYDTTATGFTVLAYADTSTFTGADPDPFFDADDELVLRARDLGDAPASAGEPPGTLPGSGLQLTVTNPLDGSTGYGYLFVTDGSLDPAVGLPPIGYVFTLLSGNCKASYDTRSGPNPEDSRVTTTAYSVHFSDRWIRNEIGVTAGGATGVDVLDRHKSLFGPGNCARSENTFSAGEGAFMMNRSGPVRALRGYLGCNSGPTSWRMHAFYEAREDCSTVLRVHPVPGIMDYFDYSPAAAGMTYRNKLNLAGVTVDGSPDPGVVTGPLAWEMVSGGQGTLAMTSILVTGIQGLPLTSYYSDNVLPTVTQCTGDPWEYGASGLRVNGEIPNTDPTVGPAQVLEAWRIIVYAAPGQDTAFAAARQAEAAHPLLTTAQPYVPTVAVTDLEPREASLMLSPNPATGRARILLTLPRAGVTRLSVHDAAGRCVAVLAEARLNAGQHAFDWDAGRVPPGLYLVRVSRDGRTQAVCRFARLR